MILTIPPGYDPKDMIYAKVIADSSILGDDPTQTRLTTVEGCLPRFVLAELNTHRMFSRNSASSRAIPVSRTIAPILSTPVMPTVWASEMKGMQGGPPLEGEDLKDAEEFWLKACRMMVEHVNDYIESHPLDNGGVRLHKSYVNRLLEPFMWHKVIISSVEWDNFYEQRCSPLAQPEFMLFAEAIRDAIAASRPRFLSRVSPEWHLPYTDNLDMAEVKRIAQAAGLRPDEVLRQVSVARVCRVSYLNHDGRADIEDDMRLYNHLATQQPPHWSPMEHVARPMTARETWAQQPGNFAAGGWLQLRHILSGQTFNSTR